MTQPQDEQAMPDNNATEQATEETLTADDELHPQDDASTSEEEADEQTNEAQIAKLTQENASLNEQMLRVQADMQNVRRRAQLDVEKAHKFGLEKFANELLSVVDNLERAIAASGEEEATKALREGVELTLNELLKTLERFNIVVINPEGEPFNPDQHQAISMVENNEVEPNSVIGVMQKGYSLNGRLLRPAMVMVSKSAPTINEKA